MTARAEAVLAALVAVAVILTAVAWLAPNGWTVPS